MKAKMKVLRRAGNRTRSQNYTCVKMCPRYYLGQWIREYEVTNENPIENLENLSNISPKNQPRFFFLWQ